MLPLSGSLSMELDPKLQMKFNLNFSPQSNVSFTAGNENTVHLGLEKHCPYPVEGKRDRDTFVIWLLFVFSCLHIYMVIAAPKLLAFSMESSNSSFSSLSPFLISQRVPDHSFLKFSSFSTSKNPLSFSPCSLSILLFDEFSFLFTM